MKTETKQIQNTANDEKIQKKEKPKIENYKWLPIVESRKELMEIDKELNEVFLARDGKTLAQKEEELLKNEIKWNRKYMKIFGKNK